MRVDPNREVSGRPEIVSTKRPEASGNASEAADLAGAAKLSQSLREIPEVRSEKVAQAKALVNEPGYPGDKTLERVAGVLADHLGPKSGAGQS